LYCIHLCISIVLHIYQFAIRFTVQSNKIDIENYIEVIKFFNHNKTVSVSIAIKEDGGTIAVRDNQPWSCDGDEQRGQWLDWATMGAGIPIPCSRSQLPDSGSKSGSDTYMAWTAFVFSLRYAPQSKISNSPMLFIIFTKKH